jgi:hypothetical protein
MNNDTQTIDLQASEPAKTSAPISGAKPAVELLKYGEKGVELSSFEDLFRFSKAVILSGLAPKGFSKPEEVLITVQYGAELGLTPMSALQNISPINGRPTIWGDAVGGICAKTGLVEDTKQEMIGTIGSDDWGYKFTVKRKGRSEAVSATFTVEKAKKAGLWGKAGPWQQYPDRMLLNRARTFCYRDAFPDALKGLLTTEEARDMPEKNVTGNASLAAIE